ncbi:MAG TPA: GNAT family N-acetyltransferase [Fimbriimonadaceae bacterium]|nr:GNAT family N-acetyltransferase [Fimbriimonadaceae bacterium]
MSPPVPAPGPRRVISTERILLVASEESMAEAVADFYRVNRAHLQPWSPPFSPDLESTSGQTIRLRNAQRSFEEGSGWRWWMKLQAEPQRIIGFAHVSQIVRGAFQSAMLGYGISSDAEGKGLMSEALSAVLDEVFSPRGKLHRIQANVVPDNVRSLALMERLGFEREGLAPEYLFIDNEWKDHVMLAKRNPNYDPNWLP